MVSGGRIYATRSLASLAGLDQVVPSIGVTTVWMALTKSGLGDLSSTSIPSHSQTEASSWGHGLERAKLHVKGGGGRCYA